MDEDKYWEQPEDLVLDEENCETENCETAQEEGSQQGEASVKHEGEAEKGETIGKFKSVEALYDAYNNLEKEFTKKCQRLSEIEKDKIRDEKKKTCEGKVGLISIYEYLRAGTNEEKCGTFNLYNSNETECFKTNWMHNIIPAGYTMWSTTPEAGTQLFSIISSGGINTNFGTSIDLIYASPVLYLTQDITLYGTGTQSDPYKIQ